MWRNRLPQQVPAVAIVALLVLTGCGASSSVGVAEFEVERLSWDSLRVEIAFARHFVIGSDQPVQPDELQFRLFDADYNALYEGAGPIVPVPDSRLGSEERLVVEACGTIEGVSICEQRMIETSPKRILFADDLTYPFHGQYERGAFDFAFRMERKVFDSDAWEPLPDAEVKDAYLVATVDGKPETSIRVSLDAARGRFDLSQHENFPEFEFRMIRGLKNGDAVPVRLELFAGLSGNAQRLASLERIVREKSREERESEMEEYVRLAVERLLEAFEPYDFARAWVRDWRFDPETRQYDVHVKVAWDGRHMDRGELDGNLLIGEDGSNAVFERDDLNRTARRLWRRHIGQDRVMLGYLELEPETAEPAVSENVIHEIARRF